jgi:hypothetical protein
MKNLMMVIGVAMVLGMAGSAMAQEATAPAAATAPVVDDSYTMDTVSGEVSGLTAKSISILYNRDYDTGTEYEILIPVDEKTVFKHKNNLKEIKTGDLVSVEYEKPGAESQHRSRAVTINFIQSGVAALSSPTTEAYSGAQQ